MSHFDLPLYQELRRAGMPRNIAHAMASVQNADSAPENEAQAPAAPVEPTAVVEKITIPEDQDVLVAADDLASKINEVIDSLQLDQP